MSHLPSTNKQKNAEENCVCVQIDDDEQRRKTTRLTNLLQVTHGQISSIVYLRSFANLVIGGPVHHYIFAM